MLYNNINVGDETAAAKQCAARRRIYTMWLFFFFFMILFVYFELAEWDDRQGLRRWPLIFIVRYDFIRIFCSPPPRYRPPVPTCCRTLPSFHRNRRRRRIKRLLLLLSSSLISLSSLFTTHTHTRTLYEQGRPDSINVSL